MRYLESSVLTLAILFGFAFATVIFNLLPGGFFPFYLTCALVLIISIAMFYGFGNTFRLRTRVYLTLAAGVTASYFSYAFFSFSPSGLSEVTGLTNFGTVLSRISHANVFLDTAPKLVQGNLLLLAVAVVDVLAMIPVIAVLGSRERRLFAGMSLREKLWDIRHDRSIVINGLKYVAHGLLLQLLATVLLVIGAFTVAGLLVLGSYFGVFLGPFVGLVVVIALLVAAVGFANILIARLLWGIPIQISVLMIASAVSMFLGLLSVNLPTVVFPQIVFPGAATAIATFFPAVLLDGLVGKKIAEAWTD